MPQAISFAEAILTILKQQQSTICRVKFPHPLRVRVPPVARQLMLL